MSRNPLLLLAVFGACKLCAQTQTFPAAVVTDQQMMVAGNNVNSTLSAPLTATATSISVASSAKFAPNMLVSFSDSTEIAVVCSVVGNVLNIGYNGSCPSVTGRGFDNTIATTHVQNAQIAGFYVAWHHNKTRVEIEAIEQSLGANLSNVNSATTVKSYGAKGDAKSVSDAGMTGGSPILTSATANFNVLTDVGKTALVAGAGPAGANLRGTITAVTDSSHVVLSGNATTSVSAGALTFGTIDSTSIQNAFASNPTGIITFTAGTYLLDNSADADGLVINGFTGSILASQGASFICTTSDVTAGNCIHILNTSGVFDGADVKYFNQAAGLPIARALAVNNALRVETSNNFELSNGTIEASTGSGVLITNSTNMFVFGVTVSQTSADGVRCDDTTCKMFGVTTSTTIGDAVSFTSSVSPARCGDFASNTSITNSAGHGFKVAGACEVYVNGFSINNTQLSGVYVLTDSTIGGVRPTGIKFSDGKIINAGQYVNSLNPVTLGQHGIEVYLTDNVAISDVDIITPHTMGMTVGSVDANSVNYFKTVNLTMQNVPNSCVSMQDVAHVDLANVRTDTCGQYGLLHNAVNDVQESNISIRNAATSGLNLNRAWWSQNSVGPISVSSLTIVDTQATATGYVVGETVSGAALIVRGLTAAITSGSLSISRSSASARFETPPPLSTNCLGSDANGSPTPCSGVGSGTVTSISASCSISGGTITASGAIATTVIPAAHNGNYGVLTGDCGKSLTTNTIATFTMPQAGSTGFATGYYVLLQNVSPSSLLTVSTTTSTFYGAGTSGTSFTIAAGNGVLLASDGTNWEVYPNYVSGTGTVTTISTGCGLSGGPLTTSGTLLVTTAIAAHNTGYMILAGDCGKNLTTNAAATYTVPAAGSAGFPAGYFVTFQNNSASGALTVSTSTSSFYGAGITGSVFSIAAGNGAQLISDGTNWQVLPYYIGGTGSVTSVGSGCGLGGGPVTSSGTLSLSPAVTAHNGGYAVLATDCGNQITSNVSAVWTLPQAGTTGFAAGTSVVLTNNSTTPNTVITVNTTTSTYSGCGRSGSTLGIPAGTTMRFISVGGSWALDNCSALTMTLIDAAARGVISDGSTDNNAILTALTSVSGGTILLPAGAVTATTGVTLGADAITLDCQGGTIRLLAGTYGILFSQFHFGQHFQNCIFDGNNMTSGVANVLAFQNLTDFIFENNTVKNCGSISGSNYQTCMQVYNGVGSKIVDNTFGPASGDGLYVNTSQPADTITISGNYFTNVSNGIDAQGSYGVTANGNHCRNIHNDPANTGTGQYGNCMVFYQSVNVVANNNDAIYIAYTGFRVDRTQGSSLTGNVVRFAGDAGIYIESAGGVGSKNNSAVANVIIDSRGGLTCTNTSDYINYNCNITGNSTSNIFGVGSDPGSGAIASGIYAGRYAKVVGNIVDGGFYGIQNEPSGNSQYSSQGFVVQDNTISDLRPVTITTTGNTGTLVYDDTISTSGNAKAAVVTNITSQTTFTVSMYTGFLAPGDVITSTGGYSATVATVLGPSLESLTLTSVTGSFQQFEYIFKGSSLATATCTGLLTRVGSSTNIVVELMPVAGGPATTCAFAPADAITGTLSGATATVSALATVPNSSTVCSTNAVCPINMTIALVPFIDSTPSNITPTMYLSGNVASGYSQYYIRGYNSAGTLIEPTNSVSYADPSVHLLSTNPRTTTYQVAPSDFVYCKTIPVASGTFNVTLVASTNQPANGQCIYLFNYGSGTVTILRSGQNINGGTGSLTVPPGAASAPTIAFVVSDGANYIGSVLGGSGSVTSVSSACGIAGGTITTSGTLSNNITIAAHNGNYTIVTGDCGKSLTTNTTAAYGLAAAGSAGFTAGYYVLVQNVSSANTLTVNTSTSNFYGAGASGTALSVAAGNAAKLVSDGNNWEVYPYYIGGTGTVTSVATSCGITGGAITTTGTVTGTMHIAVENGNYLLAGTDCGYSITTNTTATYTVPQAGTTGFPPGYYVMLQNIGASSTLTLSTSTSNFYGAGTSGTSVSVTAGNGVRLVSDGINWEVYPAYIGGTGTVTSVATGCGLTGGTITTTGTISQTVTFGVHNGNYLILTGDCSNSLTTNTTATYTFAAAGSSGFASGWYTNVQNISASNTLTLSTSTSAFYGAGSSGTSFTLAPGSAARVISDGTNWQIVLQPLVVQTHAFGYSFDGGGSALSSALTKYVTIPFACTLKSWQILVDTGTATITTWKIATGTAIPTVSNSISTSGVSISTGTAIHSTTLSDFTTTAVAAYDIFGFHLQAVSGATYVNFILECAD